MTKTELKTDPSNLTKYSYGKTKERVFDVADEASGFDALRAYCADPGRQMGYSFAILMLYNDVYTVYERWSQPCYGELCIYKNDVGKDDIKNPSAVVNKPGDLFNPFPKGEPVGVVQPLTPTPDLNKYREQVYSSEVSPWAAALKGAEVQYNKAGDVVGVLLTDMDIDPTWMVNLFKYTKNTGSSNAKLTGEFQEKYNTTFAKALLLGKVMNGTAEKPQYSAFPAYYFPPTLELSRFVKGDLKNLVEGGTFRQRYSYNRPIMHEVWGNSPEMFKGLPGLNAWSAEYRTEDINTLIERVLAV